METLLLLMIASYVVISLSSLITTISIVNFTKDLHEISRSRETKNECITVQQKVISRYKNSFLWPIELWRIFVKKEK